MSRENNSKPSRYSELEDSYLSNIHSYTLLEHKNRLLAMGAVIRQSAKPIEDKSAFYEPEDITPTYNRMYQQNAIVGRSGCIMLFHPKLAKRATDIVIMVEKNQVAYTLNRDKALELSAGFIDEVDAQHWELRDLMDAIGIPGIKAV